MTMSAYDDDSEMITTPDRSDTQSASGGWGANGIQQVGKASNVSLQAIFPKAESYTIEFNLQNIDVPDNTRILCEALVTWSVEGNFVTRRVSVANGVTLSGTGQGVKVIIEDHTDTTAVPGSVGKQYRVSLQVAPGSRATAGAPPMLVRSTFQNNGLAPGASSVAVEIPPDCGANAILVSVLDATGPNNPIALPVWVRESTDLAGLNTTFLYDPNVMNGWMPIVPGTRFIFVTNFTVAQTIIYQFALGIDG